MGLGGQQGLGPAYRLPCVGRHQVPPSIRPTDPRGHSVQPDARSPVGVTQTSRPTRLWPGSFTLLFSGLSGAHKTLTREAPLPCKGDASAFLASSHCCPQAPAHRGAVRKEEGRPAGAGLSTGQDGWAKRSVFCPGKASLPLWAYGLSGLGLDEGPHLLVADRISAWTLG